MLADDDTHWHSRFVHGRGSLAAGWITSSLFALHGDHGGDWVDGGWRVTLAAFGIIRMIEHIGDGWVWKSFRVAHLVGNLLEFLDATVAKRPGCCIGWLPFWAMFLVFVVCSSALPFFARGIFKGIFLLRFHPSDIHCFAFSLSSYNFSSHESL